MQLLTLQLTQLFLRNSQYISLRRLKLLYVIIIICTTILIDLLVNNINDTNLNIHLLN